MKPIEMVKLQLIREPNATYETKITRPGDIADLVWTLIGDKDCEHFLVLYLNTQNEINAIQTVSIGSLNASAVHPREVFKGALLYNAHSILLTHNHPSGNPKPSSNDIEITHRLEECGELLMIDVLDHLIVGSRKNYFSFREQGLMSIPDEKSGFVL